LVEKINDVLLLVAFATPINDMQVSAFVTVDNDVRRSDGRTDLLDCRVVHRCCLRPRGSSQRAGDVAYVTVSGASIRDVVTLINDNQADLLQEPLESVLVINDKLRGSQQDVHCIEGREQRFPFTGVERPACHLCANTQRSKLTLDTSKLIVQQRP